MTAQDLSIEARNAEFKRQFIAVLQDLQRDGTKDGEAMALLGALASDLSDQMGHKTWSAAKTGMSQEVFGSLVRTLEVKGRERHQAGQTKHAYVIQIMAVSLIASSLRADENLARGEVLMDGVIDRAIAMHQHAARQRPN